MQIYATHELEIIDCELSVVVLLISDQEGDTVLCKFILCQPNIVVDLDLECCLTTLYIDYKKILTIICNNCKFLHFMKFTTTTKLLK